MKMKKLKSFVLAATVSISAIMIPTGADAATTYKVNKGESFWTISNKFDVSLSSLLDSNNRSGSLLYAGETLTIPTTISSADKYLMAQLVYAEAKGEPYAGKVAVATVILNRVDHPDFPNTVKGVIYQRTGGYYAFTPVLNGAINQTPDAETIRAVNEAIAFRGKGQGSIYFYNPRTSTSNWVYSRETTITIGNHRFAK